MLVIILQILQNFYALKYWAYLHHPTHFKPGPRMIDGAMYDTIALFKSQLQ